MKKKFLKISESRELFPFAVVYRNTVDYLQLRHKIHIMLTFVQRLCDILYVTLKENFFKEGM